MALQVVGQLHRPHVDLIDQEVNQVDQRLAVHAGHRQVRQGEPDP